MYTPNNLTVFEAAFAACLAGVGASQRVITSGNAANYANPTAVAQAFAESFDTQWGAVSPDTFQVFAIKHCTYGVFSGRSPNSDAVHVNPPTYTPLSTAIIAYITQGENAAAALGITFDPWPGTGSASTKPLVRGQYIDGDTTTTALNATGSQGAPYASVTAALAKIGVGTSVSDNTQQFLLNISPATVAAYTETPALIPGRNMEFRGMGAGVGANNPLFTGNWSLANTTQGAKNPSSQFLTWTDFSAPLATLAITDDGTIPLVLCFTAELSLFPTFNTVDISGCTFCEDVVINNAIITNVISTATATGASILAVGGSIGNVTALTMQAAGTRLVGTVYAFSNNQTIKLTRCDFTNSATFSGAGCTFQMDQQTYNSFVENGGIVASGDLVIIPAVNALSAPVNIAAGTVTNMAHGDANFHSFDLTAAQPTVNLDATPTNGQRYRAKNGGLGATKALINARGGFAIEAYGNQGHYSGANGQAQFAGAGQGEEAEWAFNSTIVVGGVTGAWQIVSTA